MDPIASVDLIAPQRCVGCAARAPAPWCPRCTAQAEDLAIVPSCERCGLPAPMRPRSLEGHGCWPIRLPVVVTVAAYRYTGVVARSIGRAKALEVRGVWSGLGRHLAAAVTAAGVRRVDGVTWAPSRARVRRRRGFDHARSLAVEVARVLGVPCAGLLDPVGERPDQASLPVAERRRLPDGAFAARVPLHGARVLLVDDVITSGATARAAVRALTDGGAAPVRLAVLARAGVHRFDLIPT